MARISAACVILILICSLPTASLAEEQQYWRFKTSLLMRHYDPEPDHNNHLRMVGLERWNKNGRHVGLVQFDNSFGQPSQYLYAGKSWNLGTSDALYWSVTGGLLHGYKEPYHRKVPFNGLGIAPAVIPALGLRFRRVYFEVYFMGMAGALLTAGFTFGHH